jgi:hypothetical protein
VTLKVAQHLLAMRTVLHQRRAERLEEILGGGRRQAVASQMGDNLFLPRDVSLALRNVVVNHPEIGSREGHGRLYHLSGRKLH